MTLVDRSSSFWFSGSQLQRRAIHGINHRSRPTPSIHWQQSFSFVAHNAASLLTSYPHRSTDTLFKLQQPYSLCSVPSCPGRVDVRVVLRPLQRLSTETHPYNVAGNLSRRYRMPQAFVIQLRYPRRPYCRQQQLRSSEKRTPASALCCPRPVLSAQLRLSQRWLLLGSLIPVFRTSSRLGLPLPRWHLNSQPRRPHNNPSQIRSLLLYMQDHQPHHHRRNKA